MQTQILPFLVVNDAAAAARFYVTAFEATILEQFTSTDGRFSAKLGIASSEFWVGDEEKEFDNLSATTIGASPVRMVLITDEPAEKFSRAMDSGATQICPVTIEESWTIGKLKDPYGHIWEIGRPNN